MVVNPVPLNWPQRQITKQGPGSLECDYTLKEGRDKIRKRERERGREKGGRPGACLDLVITRHDSGDVRLTR